MAKTSIPFLCSISDPDFSLLRVFGCLRVPWLRPYAKDKLSPRSKPCIFLGYSKVHKGYKCFDRASGKIFVSRHVIFDEHVFPFSSQDAQVPRSSTNSIREPITLQLPMFHSPLVLLYSLVIT
uniref:Putative ovule protein n=1 Tax=Solanum chacoense TaxID=4108 RepID=A0A0V0HAI1_SOLCH